MARTPMPDLVECCAAGAIVLAGGEGKLLFPPPADRPKPAVPFGGNYRLIDFALSNLVNAGLFKIVVLPQDQSHSLDRQIAQTWRTGAVRGRGGRARRSAPMSPRCRPGCVAGRGGPLVHAPLCFIASTPFEASN